MNKSYKDDNNIYSWGRISFTSGDGIKKTMVIWGTSQEYLEDNKKTPEELSQNIEKEWKKKSIKDDNFFNTNVYYDPRLNSEKEEENLLQFLRTVKPLKG